jgi:DNA mismatch repair protein MutS
VTTPVRRQYLQIKRQYPDAVVFFRLGDFYETFDEDAELVSEVCDIALTSRPIGKDQRVPLAGVPYHSADAYIARLIQAGHKVAIVEQIGGGISSHRRTGMSRGDTNQSRDEDAPRGLVHREVMRVVTPGTVVEPSLLDDSRNNYLCAVAMDGTQIGLAYVDISTGEFYATQFKYEQDAPTLKQEIARLRPAEILTANSEGGQPALSLLNRDGLQLTEFEDWHFELETARKALRDQFQVATLDGFGLSGKTQAIRAAGAIVGYLSTTQKGSLANLMGIATYSIDRFMTLDAATRRNLELTETIRTGAVSGSLLGVLDHTVTPMGARLMRNRIQQPLCELAPIEQRLEAVAALVAKTKDRAELRAALKHVADVERLTNRVIQGVVRPRELQSLARSLEFIPQMRGVLQHIVGTVAEANGSTTALDQILPRLHPCDDAVRLINQSIADDPPALPTLSGIIRAGFSPELDQVKSAARDAKEWVSNLEKTERQRLGIKNLKVGFNKVFGYYIEISKSNLDTVPSEYIRKQTLVSGERFITPELKEYEALILNAEERQADIEIRVYREVCDQVAAEAVRLLDNGRAIAELDVFLSLAEVAVRHDYVRPEVVDGRSVDIVAGRHPVVETMTVDGTPSPFVPNDVHLSEEQQILVITGPNMSGKSTYLRQVALIVLMAQIGSFVPAQSAQIGLADRIFTRIGAEDIIHAGQSTFMVEMVETANILNNATPRSLLILDEIGRGTSTYDGLSIAWAVVEHIHNHPQLQARTLFATHYHELTELSDLLPRVYNLNVAVAEEGGQVVFLHKIVPGGADRSYGIHVAQLAGLPRAVVRRAEEILTRLETEDARSPLSSAEDVRAGSQRGIRLGEQLPLFSTEPHPVVKLLRGIDVNSLTPLEAISKLYDLQHQCEDEQH